MHYGLWTKIQIEPLKVRKLTYVTGPIISDAGDTFILKVVVDILLKVLLGIGMGACTGSI